MVYVSVSPNGCARVSTVPPKDVFYVEVETIPEGDGPLMLASDGTLYRLEPTPAPADPEPTQLDLIEAQVAYTAMMTNTLLEV